MILRLLIENFVLVERAELEFGPKLNILTGETGAGKSAILTAIRLILGERATPDLIGPHKSQAVVEATLKRGGVERTIRRELHASGKSRVFLDDEQLTLQELREQMSRSIELVDQSRSLTLREENEQRALLDLFARVDLTELKSAVEELTAAKAALIALEERAARSSAEEERCLEDLAALTELNYKAGEDEALSQEHHLLTHAHEILAKITQVNDALESLSTLKRFTHLLGSEPLLQKACDSLKTASLELEETSAELLRVAGSLEVSPERLEVVEERIGAIETLKRRFGPDLAGHTAKLQQQLDGIQNVGEELAACKQRIEVVTQRAEDLAAHVAAERRKAAPKLAAAVLRELEGLNLQTAQFEIALTPKPLSATGTETVEFRFAANPGQPLGPLTDQASGGELSRLLLAIKAALAEREGASTLIFDEIDSNVGGQTASLLGEKLLALSKNRQLICVTHFVQVAKCATDHFGVAKSIGKERAITTVRKLLGAAREKEFARMMGS